MGFLPPMLAKSYDPLARPVPASVSVVVQPKLDGVRMLALVGRGGSIVRLFSRTGKSFDHLIAPMFGCSIAAAAAAGTLLDGELYVHGAGFQSIVSAVKNARSPLLPRLRYHLYDVVMAAPYAARAAVVAAVAAKCRERVSAVPSVAARGAAEVEALMTRWTKEGYEGVMLRDPAAHYESGKRSASLLKYKRFLDAEFEIVGHEEASGKDAGTVVFVCTTKSKSRFRVRPMGTRAERARMLRDAPSLVGKQLTVRYQGLTDGGVPRFPVGVGVRDYE